MGNANPERVVTFHHGATPMGLRHIGVETCVTSALKPA